MENSRNRNSIQLRVEKKVPKENDWAKPDEIKPYVVVIDDGWVRDSQTFDAEGLSDEKMEDIDTEDLEYDSRWNDQNVLAYLGCVLAKNEDEAKEKIAETEHCDPRILRAIDATSEINFYEDLHNADATTI